MSFICFRRKSTRKFETKNLCVNFQNTHFLWLINLIWKNILLLDQQWGGTSSRPKYFHWSFHFNSSRYSIMSNDKEHSKENQSTLICFPRISVEKSSRELVLFSSQLTLLIKSTRKFPRFSDRGMQISALFWKILS